MKIKVFKTRIFEEKQPLIPFVEKYILSVKENIIIVITSKIVALSEGRTVEIKNEKTREETIRKESSFMIKTPHTWLTIKDGALVASAGVDESNANGKLILLPKDSFKSAKMIRGKLRKHYKVKNLGVIITDSRLLPLRSGVVGIALGYAGFKGVRDYRGERDIFGRILKVSRTDVADSLATASVLCMGEGSETQPLAFIVDAPVVFSERTNRKELFVDPKDDMYAPFFKGL